MSEWHLQAFQCQMGHLNVLMSILMAGLCRRARDIDRRYWRDTPPEEV